MGISPNGYAEPDYLGWEIKQYGVRNFEDYRPKSPVTLMTPEPTGGFYRQNGVAEFMNNYAYADKRGVPNRLNFGGIYSCKKSYHNDTGLQLRMIGYDLVKGKITDMTGGIALLDCNKNIAALWHYTSIMEHWNRKHAQAAYIPSLMRTPPPEYRYGPKILLCEKTDFSLFLRAISDGIVYYDPAIKAENATSSNPTIKRRSQFRIKHDSLSQMYHQHEYVDIHL